MLGGRAAEQAVFSDLSTGAHNDIETATALARKMVCEWGMSEKVGPLTFGSQGEEIFLGRELGMHKTFSEQTAQVIDAEIRRIVDGQFQRAQALIAANREKLDALANALLEQESMNGDEVDRVLGLKPAPGPPPETKASGVAA